MRKLIILLFVVCVHATIIQAQSWVKQTSNFNGVLTHIHFVNENLGFASGESGTILKTTDCGLTWSKKNTGDSTHLALVQFVNASIGYASGGFDSSNMNTTLIKTTDGGETWTSLSVEPDKCGGGMYFINADTGFYAYADVLYGNSFIAKTTNGGNTWTEVYDGDNDSNVWISHFFFVDAQNGYASANQGHLLKTTDGGNNWTVMHVGRRLWGSALWFFNADTGLVGGHPSGSNSGQSGVFRTNNGGNSWTEINTGNNMLFKFNFASRQIGYGLEVDQTGKGILVKTTNGGDSWTNDNIPNQQLRGVHFINPSRGYAVGDSGAIYAYGMPVGMGDDKLIESDLNIFPNPAHNYIQISSEKHNLSMVNVFDYTGRKVITHDIKKHGYSIDISMLPNGIYTYHAITVDNKIANGKILINH
jgi:photosystem II stability/assembly factor-like uncharacterized protein